MPQLATVLKAGWRVFCCGPAAYASQVHVKFSHLHREIRNFEYEYALHRIPLVGNKSWRENGRKRAQYVAIRERLSALRNDSSMLSPPFLILSLLGLTEMTLVNNVSSFIIDVCNTRHCCAAVASRRAPSTFVYRRKTEKLTHSRCLSFLAKERKGEMGVGVCLIIILLRALARTPDDIWPQFASIKINWNLDGGRSGGDAHLGRQRIPFCRWQLAVAPREDID